MSKDRKVIYMEDYKNEEATLKEIFNLDIEYEKETCIIASLDFMLILMENPNIEYYLDDEHTILLDPETSDIVITDMKTEQQIYLAIKLQSKEIFTRGAENGQK